MRLILLTALLLALPAASALSAAPIVFDLPPQPAHKALVAFARQAGVEVLFASNELKRVRTVAVQGSLEPSDAIDRMLEGTGYTATINAAGKFVVTKLPADAPPAPSPAPDAPIGTPTAEAPRMLWNDDVVTLADYVITPSRFGIADERLALDVTLTSEELENLPQLGEDTYRAITRLPGLTSSDISANFWVRGAPNHQMLARFDGVDLVEPFHLKDYDGALSIVDIETLGSVTLTTGGFTANYGDKLAGVLDLASQPPSGRESRTTLGLSVTHMRVTNEGSFADGKGHWLAAARRGYVDLALKLSGEDADDTPVFYDLSGNVSYQLSPDHTLSFHVLHSDDSLEVTDEYNEPDLRSSYGSTYLWGRWLGRFGDRLSCENVLSWSTLEWNRDGDGFFDEVHPFSLRDRRRLDLLGLRTDWSLDLAEYALLRAGAEFKTGEADYDYFMSRVFWNLDGGELLTTERTVDTAIQPEGDTTGAHLALRIQPWSSFVVEPGVRFDRASHIDESAWSPRLNASYTAGRTTFRAAWGTYRQSPGLHEIAVPDGETDLAQAEEAEQRVIGISHELGGGYALRLEAYQRLIDQPRHHWENLINLAEVFPEAQYDRIRVTPTEGRAHGIEVILERRNRDPLSWSVSYAYAVSEEKVGGAWFPRIRDQRHSFYADLTWSPAPNWQISCAWQYHTGWPMTDTGFYAYPLNNGTVVYPWYYGEMSALRAPGYHRLDLRATRTFHLKHGTLQAFVDLFNAYDRKNTYGWDEPYAEVVNGVLTSVKPPMEMFPLLPSAGLSWTF